MRCRFLVFLAALLALTPLGVAPAMAQDQSQGDGANYRIGQQHDDWAGVSRPAPLPGAFPTDGGVLQPYEIYFSEDYAAIPEIPDTEFMVVRVMEGDFVLATGKQGTFVVHPEGGQPIQYMDEIPYKPYFVVRDAYVQDTAGQVCISVCGIPLDSAVQLKPGDVAVLQSDSICLWCVLNERAEVADTGLLIASVLLEQGMMPDEFSWVESWEATQGEGVVSSEDQATPVAMAWAFNPQARCRGK